MMHLDPAVRADLPHPQPTRDLLSLPNELLLEVAEHLFSRTTYDAHRTTPYTVTTFRDARAFLLVNRRLNQLLTPLFLRRAISGFSLAPSLACPHRSILHWAAANNSSPNLWGKLRLYGGSKLINRVDCKQTSPLLAAVLYNNATATELLLKEGADVKLGNPSPLLCAVVFAYHDIVGLLLGAGADTEERTVSGCTLLHLASMISNAEKASIIKKALVQAGANENARQHLGYTPAQIEDMVSEAKALGAYREGPELGTVILDQIFLADLEALPWLHPFCYLRRRLLKVRGDLYFRRTE